MKSDTTELLEKALKLPVEARAALAGSLIESLNETVDEDAEAAWADEITRRIRELDSGIIETLPHIRGNPILGWFRFDRECHRPSSTSETNGVM